MYCPNCGTQCEETHHYCYQCGTALPPLPQPAPEHEQEIPVPMDVTASPAALPEETLLVDAALVNEPEEDSILPAEAAAPSNEPPVPADEPEKKGRFWPPLLTMAILICTGLFLFFMNTSIPQEPTDPTSSPFFTVDNGVLSFHPEHYTGGPELEIPAEVDGQTVTAIADYAFSGYDGITTVILPETVTHIGDYAFSSCANLRGMFIPGTVTTVGVYAFADCDELEAVYLPGSLSALGHGSLDSCDGLKYILFDGTYDQWNKLYSGYFTTNVELHTIDGTYYARP